MFVRRKTLERSLEQGMRLFVSGTLQKIFEVGNPHSFLALELLAHSVKHGISSIRRGFKIT
ncbi:hypothetical protein ACHAXS_006203 [Conticribra weissflogii]